MTLRLFFRKILTTPNFFNILAKHLDRIFPNGWICDAERIGYDIECSVDSSGGWAKALYHTCTELNISDIYDYWAKLDWETSDWIDGEISMMLCATVYDENNQRINN